MSGSKFQGVVGRFVIDGGAGFAPLWCGVVGEGLCSALVLRQQLWCRAGGPAKNIRRQLNGAVPLDLMAHRIEAISSARAQHRILPGIYQVAPF